MNNLLSEVQYSRELLSVSKMCYFRVGEGNNHSAAAAAADEMRAFQYGGGCSWGVGLFDDDHDDADVWLGNSSSSSRSKGRTAASL